MSDIVINNKTMDSQIDPNLVRSINVTKKLLGKHISKPVLADKHLGRPPFRFLLEIVNNVIQQTSFMKNVFSPKELKYDEISSAGDKRAILKKVIEAIEKETGEKCEARTSKILSGKEPEKTNEMLQLLAKAITSFSKKAKESTHQAVSPSEEKERVEKGEPQKDSRKKAETIKTVKSPAVSSPSVRRSSANNSAAVPHHVKAKSSPGDKPTLPVKTNSCAVKPSGSSASIKTTSKEAIKSKPTSPSASSSAMKLLPKKLSNTNLTKSPSRRLLVAKSNTSLSKTDIQSEPAEKVPETQTYEESEKKGELISGEPKLHSTAAMPPETTAEIPLQRPVTRTKYRQKNNEVDLTTVEGKVGQAANSEDPQNTLATPVAFEHIEGKRETHYKEETEKQDVDKTVGESRSGRSTSSEEGITEHMNQKISEWRASSAVVQEEMVVFGNESGWITFDETCQPRAEEENRNTPLKRGFQSVENCNDVVTSLPEKTDIVREDLNRKSLELQRPVTVLKDFESGDDDDEMFLVQEKMEYERDRALERLQQGAVLLNGSAAFDMAYLPPEHRGMLVNQIMETKRDLEKLTSSARANDLENELAERDKAAVRVVYLKQMEDLKAAIQKMSKCTNPLANIVQRSQDDACLIEIEFRKLRQENEQLQRKLDEAKGETSRILYPLTEELAGLDRRIEKVEEAIFMAKQRLSLIDLEYAGEFIAQLENAPTDDETRDNDLKLDPVWQFKGNFPDEENDDDGISNGGIKNKSLLNVFQRAVGMFADGDSSAIVRTPPRKEMNLMNSFGRPTPTLEGSSLRMGSAATLRSSERRLLNRTIYGEDSPMGRRTTRVLNLLEQTETEVNKENKPSWWD